jgi:single-stranded-DNA-specific exonuclease
VVEPEALLRLERIDRSFFAQMQRLEPFGIGHPTPLFWSSGCEVAEARLLRGGHLQLLLAQDGFRIRAMAWRWQGEGLPQGPVDVAYHLRLDRWQGQERLQLELKALRPRQGEEVVLQRRDRTYWCRREGQGVVIRNAAGEERRQEELALAPSGMGSAEGGESPYVEGLFRDAAMALGLSA